MKILLIVCPLKAKKIFHRNISLWFSLWTPDLEDVVEDNGLQRSVEVCGQGMKKRDLDKIFEMKIESQHV